MDGILVVDKPVGLTSHDVVNRVRRVLHTRRVGHAGTLDPLASGVLVLGVGRGTRLLEYLSAAAKSYVAQLQLGVTSETLDAEGPLHRQDVTDWPSLAQVHAAVRTWTGSVSQIPPQHSAIHINGARAYDLARQGQEVVMPARQVEIFRHEIVSYSPPSLTLDLTVSKGTYIRSIARDIGEQLSVGAYLAGLRRTASGHFMLEHAVSWDDLLTSTNPEVYLLSFKLATDHLYTFVLDESQISDLQHGRQVAYTTTPPQTIGRVIYHGQLIAIVKWQDQALQSVKVLEVSPLEILEKQR